MKEDPNAVHVRLAEAWPESLLWGSVVPIISIRFMWLFIRAKVKVGRG